METKLFSQDGNEIGTVELDDSIFGLDVNNSLIHRALVYQLANNRKNIAHTKNRSEVRGSTRKLFRQKGTGNARVGSIRSPIRRKGGVVFGPRNTQNFSIEMNKKERRKALFCALSSKVKSDNLVVIDSLNLDKISTKEFNNLLSKFNYEKNILLVTPVKDEKIAKSSANLPYVKNILVNYLNIADLLKYEKLFLLKDSIEKINSLKF